MKDQKTLFREIEGDLWFERNEFRPDPATEIMIDALKTVGAAPKATLEIGSSAGLMLERMHQEFGGECHGVEPSQKAVQRGQSLRPALTFVHGTADDLPYPDRRFDLVILGFCLYMCDPADYFRIAWQADRVLRDGGLLVIKDFSSPIPYKQKYSHAAGVYSHKMDWSTMFCWNPAYRLLVRTYSEQVPTNTFHPDEQIAVDILRKDQARAFVANPYRPSGEPA